MTGQPLLLLAALAVVGLVAVVADRMSRWPDFFPLALLYVVGLTSVVSGLVRVGSGSPSFELTGPQVLLGQMNTAATVMIGLLALARARRRPPGAGLWIAVAALAVTTAALSLYHGQATVEVPLLYLLAVTVLFTAPALDVDRVVTAAKVLLGAHIVLSAAALVFAPAASLSAGHAGLIPGFTIRAYGITTHPNELGWLAFLYLLVEYYRPSPRRVSIPAVAVGVAMLILSQSKTAWAVALVAAAFLLWPRLDARRRTLLVTSVAVLVALLGRFVFADLTATIVESDTGESIVTLTGRTRVWDEGLDGWLERPLVGQGPDFFRDFAARTGASWAGQSHNQFVESAATGGLVALAALLLLAWQLVVVGLRHRAATCGASLALAVSLLLRSFTETPLDGASFDILLAFALFFAWERVREARAASPQAPVSVDQRVPVSAA